MIEVYRDKLRLVRIEKVKNNDWWVELVEIKTGMTQVIQAKTKEIAQEMFKGMTIEDIIKFYNETMKVEKLKVYKEGVV